MLSADVKAERKEQPVSADLELTRDGELMVVQVEGTSEQGVEFVDAYQPERADTGYVVVDSGRIILPEAGVEHLLAAAKERGLVTA